MPVVPCLDEGRDQLDERFPKRDKASDGAWGDAAHRRSTSSHNGDESGKPEFNDHDKVDEVRARDFDKDLNDAETGTTMEQVVQEWVRLCRAGKMWWVRYIIFNGRIWHKKDGFKTHKYTGKNKHDKHAHVNSDFTKKADTAKKTDWGLKNFRRKSNKPKPRPTESAPNPNRKLEIDGQLGPETIRRWQKVMGTPVDGEISEKSSLVRAVQLRLKSTVDHRLVVDGDGDSLALGVTRKTVEALQRYLKVPVTRRLSDKNSTTIKALQVRLNEGRF